MNKLTAKLNLFIISIYAFFSKLTAFAEEGIDNIEIDDTTMPEIEIIPELPEEAVPDIGNAVSTAQSQSFMQDHAMILCAILIGVILLIVLLVFIMIKGKKTVKSTNTNKENDNDLRKSNQIKSSMDVEGAVKSFLIITETMR